MRPSHKQFAPQYASMFGDASVVHAYQYRPPYPPETFEVLISLIDPDAASRTVLDAGCGPGTIARALVRQVDRVDAVDVAAHMITAGKGLPGGMIQNCVGSMAPSSTRLCILPMHSSLLQRVSIGCTGRPL